MNMKAHWQGCPCWGDGCIPLLILKVMKRVKYATNSPYSESQAHRAASSLWPDFLYRSAAYRESTANHADMSILVPKTFLVFIVNEYIGRKEATSIPPALLGTLRGSRCPLLSFENINGFSNTSGCKCLQPKGWRSRIVPFFHSLTH